MFMKNKCLPLFISCLLIVSSCRKDIDKKSCRELREAVIADEKIAANASITALIKGLPHREHTAENLQSLTDSINRSCEIFASVLCFACIQTLPEQSEIRLSATDGSGTVVKIIDISSNDNNQMIFVNMHN
jgi:hypothetical protein